MKKILMTLAAVAVSATMSAQVYVGGFVGLTSESSNGNSQTQISVAPEIGYVLSDNAAVGISLGIADDGVKDANTTTFKIAPYYRYTFLKLDKVNLFLDGGIAYEHAGEKNGRIDSNGNLATLSTNTFGIGVKPGVAFNVNDKISLVAKLGWLGYTTKSTNETGSKSVNTFGLQVGSDKWNTSALELGFYYNF